MGQVNANEGLLFEEKEFKLVKQTGQKGDFIEKHTHPEAKVVFTVVKGKYKVNLDDEEEYILEPGQVLFFDGKQSIQAEYMEDSEAFVSLILK